jgi:hypothetical protein
MRLLETAADCTEEEILRIAKSADRRPMRFTIRLAFLPVIAQVAAVLLVPDAVLAPGGWGRAIVESSAVYLPLMDYFLLSGDAYLHVAFAHWVGFVAAVLALLLATFEPTFKSLIPAIINAACGAMYRGKTWRPGRALVGGLGGVLGLALGNAFALAGTRGVHLGHDDLHRNEYFILFLLEMPVLHATLGGLCWASLMLLVRGWLGLAANVHRLDWIYRTLDDHGFIQPVNPMGNALNTRAEAGLGRMQPRSRQQR